MWVSSNTHGVYGRSHLTALCFIAISIPYMALVAAYPGHFLVRFITERIHFDTIPRSYSVWGAVICAIIAGIMDYRVESRKQYWGSLFLTHGVIAILASFWLYVVALLIVLAVLSMAFDASKRYAHVYKRVYDSVPDYASHAVKAEITEDIMHSSLRPLIFFRFWNEKSEE